MPDSFDAARESLRAYVTEVRTPAELAADARMRSEVVARIAKLRGPELAAFRDAARALVPDEELDRMLKLSA